jgi:hypothetical protein
MGPLSARELRRHSSPTPRLGSSEAVSDRASTDLLLEADGGGPPGGASVTRPKTSVRKKSRTGGATIERRTATSAEKTVIVSPSGVRQPAPSGEPA